MAKGDTKTNQYLDIAANGTRADLPTDTCCETRSQTLIREVAERIMDVEDEVEELKNNPDVVDIVATYADLQAYDTQHLTDKDIIRVLQDETHDGESTYYRYNKQSDTWTYVGTVGDYYTKTAADAKFQDKLTAGSNITISDQNVISATDTTYSNFTGTDGTTAGTAGLVPAPTTTDGDKYLKGDGTWGTVQAGSNYTAGDGINISAQDVISATNTGKARELTAADYNWPTTGTATSVALWLLPAGSYYAAPTVSVAAAAGLSAAIFNGSPDIIVMGNDEYGTKSIAVYAGNGKWKVFTVNPTSGGAQSLGNTTLAQSDISQSTGTSTSHVMSQNATTNAIKAISKSGSGAPSTSTVGTVGQLYQDTTNGDLYICTDATNPYVWEEVGGGSGPTVVQTTGTSTTDVMSQNAVSRMVFADPSTEVNVRIGSNANNTGEASVVVGRSATANRNNAVAIGRNAQATTAGMGNVAIGNWAQALAQSSVALGQFSKATQKGQIDVSTSYASDTLTEGYNNSQYRLLTGLYDPQSDHDAATKGYCDNAIINGGTTAPTTATVGAVGTQYTYVDTTGTHTAHLCVCTEIDTTDPSTPVYTWQTLI